MSAGPVYWPHVRRAQGISRRTCARAGCGPTSAETCCGWVPRRISATISCARPWRCSEKSSPGLTAPDAASLPAHAVEAADARTARGDIQKGKTIQDRELAAVLDGDEPHREVRDEVRGRHLARGDERRDPGEQAEHDQHAGHQFDDARRAEQRSQRDRSTLAADAAEHPEQLLGAVKEEKERRDDPEQGIHLRGIPLWNHVVSFVVTIYFMASTTIVFGLLLTLLGLAGYFLTGTSSLTALIPAIFGVPLLLLGFVARSEHSRKHAMHVAALLGTIGFIGALMSLLRTPTGEIGRAHV